VQKMQREMEEAQEALKHETVEASAGGGMVSVKVSGDLQIQAVRIAPEAADPEDVEMLGDMVLAAVNEALRGAQELAAEKLGGATGGLDLGALGGLGLPGLYGCPHTRLIPAPAERVRSPSLGGPTRRPIAQGRPRLGWPIAQERPQLG
jgi:nucleoid-associated protein EbfC